MIDLPYEITEEKKKEIENLEYVPIGRAKNLTGKTFNHLTILGRAKNSPNQKCAIWWAICDCPEHNIKNYRMYDIEHGKVKSCGCYLKQFASKNGKKNKKDYTGEIVGDFIAVAPTEHYSSGNIKWLFKCTTCGYEKENAIGDLRKGFGCVCPQCHGIINSLGEEKIIKILTDLNINFILHYHTNKCKFIKTGKEAYFDFYLPELNIMIEYDGIQHFVEREGWSDKDTLKERQARDNFKTKWCEENNIPLIRIPYIDFKILDKEYLIKRLKEVKI